MKAENSVIVASVNCPISTQKSMKACLYNMPAYASRQRTQLHSMWPETRAHFGVRMTKINRATDEKHRTT